MPPNQNGASAGAPDSRWDKLVASNVEIDWVAQMTDMGTDFHKSQADLWLPLNRQTMPTEEDVSFVLVEPSRRQLERCHEICAAEGIDPARFELFAGTFKDFVPAGQFDQMWSIDSWFYAHSDSELRRAMDLLRPGGEFNLRMMCAGGKMCHTSPASRCFFAWEASWDMLISSTYADPAVRKPPRISGTNAGQ